MKKKKADATEPTLQSQPKPVPQLTAAEQLVLRNMQVRALVLEQNQYVQQYRQAIQELNTALQATMTKHPEWNFDLDRLEFVAVGK
jgi:hypothetical protein